MWKRYAEFNFLMYYSITTEIKNRKKKIKRSKKYVKRLISKVKYHNKTIKYKRKSKTKLINK